MDELLATLFGDDERAVYWTERIKSAIDEGYVKREVLDGMVLDFAIRRAIHDAGARNEKAVMALLDIQAITLEDGEAVGIAEQLAAIKESDPYLFYSENRRLTGMTPAEGVKENEKRPATGLFEAVAKHFSR